MKTREIEVAGYTVEVYTFGNRSFYYPAFNGNREYPVTAKGFRDLSSFLRTCSYFDRMLRAYA